MKKLTVLLLTGALTAGFAMAEDEEDNNTSNLSSGYPDPTCEAPEQLEMPEKPSGNTLEEKEAYNESVIAYNNKIPDYNKAINDYMACMKEYIDNANNDLDMIHNKAKQAAKQANEAR